MKKINMDAQRLKAGFLGLILLGAAFQSCGGLNQNEKSSQLKDEQTLSTEPYDKIDWYFPCPFDAVDSPDRLIVPAQTNPRNLVWSGVGPFEMVKEYMVRVPVTVHGRVCPWKIVHRDVTFIIDVSGSMAGFPPPGQDPAVPEDPANEDGPKTCARLKTLETLIAKLPPNITKFGVATYDDVIVNFSTKLFSDKAALYKDLMRDLPSSGHIADIVCRAGNGTKYLQALNQAKEMLAKGEAGATKEVLFLSDGEPEDTDEQILATTNDMKKNGIVVGGRRQNISIATVLLGENANEEILKKMASVDASVIPPKPVFAKAADAEQLAEILGRMIDNNKLQGSKVVHSGDSPALPRKTIDVFSQLDAKNQFVTAPFVLNVERTQQNYKLDFEYWDTMQNRSTYPGVIRWLPPTFQ